MIHVSDTSVDIDAPLNMDPQKSWNVQFFRSITSDSAVFDEERVENNVSINITEFWLERIKKQSIMLENLTLQFLLFWNRGSLF